MVSHALALMHTPHNVVSIALQINFELMLDDRGKYIISSGKQLALFLDILSLTLGLTFSSIVLCWGLITRERGLKRGMGLNKFSPCIFI
jgi:hypothetical protein